MIKVRTGLSIKGVLDTSGYPIRNVGAPVDDTDAVTKAHVEEYAAPAALLGQPGGIALLDGTGKLPVTQLPAAAGGTSAVTSVNGYLGDVVLVAADIDGVETPAGAQVKADAAAAASIPLTQKGAAGGVASLDGSGKVPTGQSQVASVAGRTGAVTLTSTDVGLGNVDNTSDASKPVSTAQAAADTAAKARANHTGTQTAATISDFATAADARITAQKGAASGLAPLDSGSKIPSNYLSAIAITSTSTVASQAAQLALTAQEGDVAIRSDLNQTFIHNGGSTATMADWTLLATPTDTVTSVAGRTGVVTLAAADVAGVETPAGAQAKADAAAAASIPVTQKGAASGVASLGPDSKVPAAQSQVSSVAGRTGAVVLAAADVSGVETPAGAQAKADAAAAASIPLTQKAVAGGVATLGVDGKVPAIQLPAGTGGGGGTSAVTSVNTRIGDVVLTAADVGLDNVNNTSDADKPVSTAQAAADTAAKDRANHTGTQTAATISDFSTAADARITAQKGAASGIAPLGPDSMIASNYLPAIAITSTYTAASQAAQLALNAQEGDVAIRTDLSQTFIRNAGTAGTMADWTLLATPTDTVTSVAGRTGVVTLSAADVSGVETPAGAQAKADAAAAASIPVIQKGAASGVATLGSDGKVPSAQLPASTGGTVTAADVGLGNVDNTSDANKPVSTAQAAADALKVSKTGDTMSGDLNFGNANKVIFGTDTNLYRYGVDVLTTDDDFLTGRGVSPGPVNVQRSFYFNFSSAVANEKADIYFGGTGNIAGAIEVTVSGILASGSGAQGIIQAVYHGGWNVNGSMSQNGMIITQAAGALPGQFALMPIAWDATNSRYKITVGHLTTQNNEIGVSVRFFAGATAYADRFRSTCGASAIYTTDTTVPTANEAALAAPTVAGNGTVLKLRPVSTTSANGELQITKGSTGTALTLVDQNGANPDTNLYRSAANVLTTDDTLTAVSGVVAGNASAYTLERVFQVAFPAGTDYKADIYIPGGVNGFGGTFEVTLTGQYGGANAEGMVRALYNVTVNATGTFVANMMSYTDVHGTTANFFGLMAAAWDATNSRVKLTIAHRTAEINSVFATVKVFGTNYGFATVRDGMGVSAPYNTDTSTVAAPTARTYPLAVYPKVGQWINAGVNGAYSTSSWNSNRAIAIPLPVARSCTISTVHLNIVNAATAGTSPMYVGWFASDTPDLMPGTFGEQWGSFASTATGSFTIAANTTFTGPGLYWVVITTSNAATTPTTGTVGSASSPYVNNIGTNATTPTLSSLFAYSMTVLSTITGLPTTYTPDAVIGGAPRVSMKVSALV